MSRLAIASKASWGYSESEMTIFRDELNIPGERLVSLSGHVAETGGEIVGYYTLTEHSSDVIELEHLFVDPKWFRQGIGAQLLEHAVSQCRDRGFRRMKIISDPNAPGFYTRHGAAKAADHQSSIPGRTIPVLEIDLG